MRRTAPCCLALAAAVLVAPAPAPAEHKARATIEWARCLRPADCDASGAVTPGRTLRLRGSGFVKGSTVVFYGRPGGADNVTAPARFRTPRTLDLRVPRAAASGRIAVRPASGPRSRAGPQIRIARLGPKVERARVTHRTIFQCGAFGISYRFAIAARSRSAAVVVRLYRGARSRNRLVYSWRLGRLATGETHTFDWHGALPGGWAFQGTYTLELEATDAAGHRLDLESVERSRERIRFYRHAFPVRGERDLGGRTARFGANRGARVHRGHDVFAPVGTRVVAARRGRVAWKQYQGGGAGHYLVIHGDDDVDYAYMHLRGPAYPDPGDVVRTGQMIGRVGCSGSCHGSHLHFEMWTPHWFDGGEPFDPLEYLRRWGRWS
jgi:murein DD-endopeptidase MepM/ murein hydrolase activator NlpD